MHQIYLDYFLICNINKYNLIENWILVLNEQFCILNFLQVYIPLFMIYLPQDCNLLSLAGNYNFSNRLFNLHGKRQWGFRLLFNMVVMRQCLMIQFFKCWGGLPFQQLLDVEMSHLLSWCNFPLVTHVSMGGAKIAFWRKCGPLHIKIFFFPWKIAFLKLCSLWDGMRVPIKYNTFILCKAST